MPYNDVTHESVDTFDDIARDLRALRARSGSVSYAEIGRRIGRLRQNRGAPPLTAIPARTTVYDAFRDGRSRVNASLVGDIARALGASESDALAWQARCAQGHAAGTDAVTDDTTAAPVVASTRAIPTPFEKADPGNRTVALWKQTTLLILACVALNVAGITTATWFGLPLFLDMIGTAVAAFALGPWRAALVAALSHVAAALFAISSVPPLPFVLVNIVGGLLWGYGVHRLWFGASLLRFLGLNAIVGIACAAVAIPLALSLFAGNTAPLVDDTASRLIHIGWPLELSASASIAVSSIADKILTGFLALALVALIRRRTPAALPLMVKND